LAAVSNRRGHGSQIMSASFWLAFTAFLIPTFPLGYFWHLKTFAAEYEKLDLCRDEVIIPMGLASTVIQALFFATEPESNSHVFYNFDQCVNVYRLSKRPQ
jgi:hypothetical protein